MPYYLDPRPTPEGPENLYGDDFDNTIAGLGGADTISGRAGDDTLLGGTGDDRIGGGDGDDFVSGGDDDDVISGGSGSNTLDGGAGDDVLVLDNTQSSYQGGTGNDTIRAEFAPQIQSLDLTEARGIEVFQFLYGSVSGNDEANTFDLSGIDRFVNLGTITLRGGDDIYVGSEQTEQVDGGAGDDSLSTGGGNDTIDTGGGVDTVDAGAGDDLVILRDGTQIIQGGSGDDTARLANFRSILAGLDLGAGSGIETFDRNDLRWAGTDEDDRFDFSGVRLASDMLDTPNLREGDDVYIGSVDGDLVDGGDGNDSISGNGGDDTLAAGSGSDTLEGGAGDDVLILGGGSDRAFGGAGDDTVRLSSSADGFNLLRVEAEVVDLGTNRFNVIDGTGEDDVFDLTRVDAYETVGRFGLGAGDDVFRGSAAGGDQVGGGSGDDDLRGGGGVDTLDGGDGNDTLEADAGSTLDGGAGSDLYITSGDGYTIVENASDEGIDTLRTDRAYTPIAGIERVELTGQDDLRIDGTAGDERFVGNGGDNLIVGFGGEDTVTGGAGADIFAFFDPQGDIPTMEITDFSGRGGEGDRIAVDDQLLGIGDSGFDVRAFTFADFQRVLALGTVGYNAATGAVRVDPDGPADPTDPFDDDFDGLQPLAQLDPGTQLTISDVILF